MAANLRSYDRLRATLLAPAPGVVQDQPVLITNLHLALYRYRADVAQRHDIATREGRRAFLEWLQVHPRAEMFGDPARPAAQVPPPTDSAGVNLIGYAYAEMGSARACRRRQRARAHHRRGDAEDRNVRAAACVRRVRTIEAQYDPRVTAAAYAARLRAVGVSA